jgi:HPt (histidine-containing phosphotransfer) domain-containing protein
LWQTNKKKEAHFHAHTVKGSALQIGGYRVGAVAAKFETELEKCAATSLANVMPAAEELRAAYDEFVETLKAYVAQ